MAKTEPLAFPPRPIPPQAPPISVKAPLFAQLLESKNQGEPVRMEELEQDLASRPNQPEDWAEHTEQLFSDVEQHAALGCDR